MSDVENWLRQEHKHIEAILDDFAVSHMFFGQRPQNRLPLSDLGLCRVVGQRKISFPRPYQPKKVSVISAEIPEGTPHFVGYDGINILDLVAGQFFVDDLEQISGVALMLERAPQLFYVISDELTVLHATAEDIHEKLGLEYSFIYP